MQLQEYFDQMAPTWNKELTRERLNCLDNIVKELDIEPGNYVLDIGCGTGVLLPLLIEALGDEGKIIALDFSAEMLVQGKAKSSPPIVNFVQADGMFIPMANNSIDMVLCNSVFPHFSDKAKALKEITRVLRNNGRLAICHTMSRKMINQLHQSIGGVIANDLLPDEFRLRELIKKVGLNIIHFEDSPERYLVIAKKSAY